MEFLRIALPKGRLYSDTVKLLEAIDIEPPDFSSRRLVARDEERNLEYVLVKPGDVPTYVAAGVCDLGIVGKDVLLEEKKDVYELLDLKFGVCQFVLAAKREDTERGGFPDTYSRLRVATKFPNVAREYLRQKGLDAEIIQVRGNTELAPLIGLAELIVDIVSSGKTIRENNLTILETIGDKLSARLIANPGSLLFKGTRIRSLAADLAGACESAREVQR